MISQQFFISDTPVEREVTLPDGSSHKFKFKELSAIEYNAIMAKMVTGEPQKQAQATVELIAKSLCDDDGKTVLSVEQAKKLTPSAANALVGAVFDVNSGVKKN